MLSKILNGGLRRTLMATTVLSHIFCITILLIIITDIQSNQLKQLNTAVNGVVEKNNSETKRNFITLANKVNDDLKKGLGNTPDTLAIEISQKIVTQTEFLVQQITNDLDTGLHDSANALAALLIWEV